MTGLVTRPNPFLLSNKDLNQVKLREVDPNSINDSSDPLTHAFLDNSEEVTQYQSTVLEANIENWIDLLGPTTFPTVFVPLTVDDAHFLIRVYETIHLKQSKLSQDDQALSDILEAKLDDAIQRIRKAECDPVFVKLSSRSAKDAPVAHSQLKSLYSEFMKQETDKSVNNRIAMLLRAGTDMLKATCGRDALNLFYHSERVWQDMQLALDNIHCFRENFVVRQWVDMDPQYEFRGFVYSGKLTALSQYNHLVRYPDIVENGESICDMLRKWFDAEVAHRITGVFDECIVDFGLSKGDFKPWIIELNPFLESTDGALFSWKDDIEQLKHGPFEFRLQRNIIKSAGTQLKIEWRDIIHDISLTE